MVSMMISFRFLVYFALVIFIIMIVLMDVLMVFEENWSFFDVGLFLVIYFYQFIMIEFS